MDNPFAGATTYVNPDYTAKAEATAAQTSDAQLAAKMRAVGQYRRPSWLDRIAAIDGTGTSRGLAAHLDAALAQYRDGKPVVATIVVYDLPNRDCAALASNGELSVGNNGQQIYRTQYIDRIAAILANPKYKDVRIVTIIEPDSLPNLVTNSGVAVAEAQSSGAYVNGIRYALDRLHAIPNVYTYLDIAHSGWLGWDDNLSRTVQLYAQTIQGTAAHGERGRVHHQHGELHAGGGARTSPTRPSPWAASRSRSARFYEWNPVFDESDFAATLYSRFVAAGLPTSIQVPARHVAQRLGRLEAAGRCDRERRRQLCQLRQGRPPRAPRPVVQRRRGRPGRTAPGGSSGYGAAHLDAFVWVKPPGESDGASGRSQTPRASASTGCATRHSRRRPA